MLPRLHEDPHWDGCGLHGCARVGRGRGEKTGHLLAEAPSESQVGVEIGTVADGREELIDEAFANVVGSQAGAMQN